MRGISSIIVVIMLLMISVAMAGLAYTFLSATMSSTTSSASSAVSSTISGMLTSFTVESVDVAKVYVRNTGQSDLTNLSVYVNDVPVHFNVTPSVIKAGQIGTVTIYDFLQANDNIKVTTASGFSVVQKAPDPCARAVGCWKFDESGGTTAYDSSPNGNNGVLTNGPVWTSGRYGGGLTFDGVNDYVNVSNNPSLTFLTNGNFTITFWAKLVFVNTNVVLSKGLYATDGWYLQQYGTNQLRFTSEPDHLATATSLNAFQNNVWFHFAMVKSGNNVSFYINGIYDTPTQNAITNMQPSTRNLHIMNYDDNTLASNGTIDEVRVYNRAIY